jgi:hypothetical protein
MLTIMIYKDILNYNMRKIVRKFIVFILGLVHIYYYLYLPTSESSMKKILLLYLFFIPELIMAQGWKEKPIAISAFNNATLFPPASVTAVFDQPLHAGLTASYEFGWKETGKYKWFQNASIGYFYHRYVDQAVLLYSQAGYRRYFGKFSAEGSLHSGYMHSFLLTERAVKQSDGSYKAKQGWGKPQFIAGAGVGFGYNIGSVEKLRRLFLNYDIRMQTPFVKSYVPVLPNGALSLGIQFIIK